MRKSMKKKPSTECPKAVPSTRRRRPSCICRDQSSSRWCVVVVQVVHMVAQWWLKAKKESLGKLVGGEWLCLLTLWRVQRRRSGVAAPVVRMVAQWWSKSRRKRSELWRSQVWKSVELLRRAKARRSLNLLRCSRRRKSS